MSDLETLKARVLEIAKERKVDYSQPVSITELVYELGEDSKGLIHNALISLTLKGKIGTKGSGSGLSINKVYK